MIEKIYLFYFYFKFIIQSFPPNALKEKKNLGLGFGSNPTI